MIFWTHYHTFKHFVHNWIKYSLIQNWKNTNNKYEPMSKLNWSGKEGDEIREVKIELCTQDKMENHKLFIQYH